MWLAIVDNGDKHESKCKQRQKLVSKKIVLTTPEHNHRDRQNQDYTVSINW